MNAGDLGFDLSGKSGGGVDTSNLDWTGDALGSLTGVGAKIFDGDFTDEDAGNLASTAITVTGSAVAMTFGIPPQVSGPILKPIAKYIGQPIGRGIKKGIDKIGDWFTKDKKPKPILIANEPGSWTGSLAVQQSVLDKDTIYPAIRELQLIHKKLGLKGEYRPSNIMSNLHKFFGLDVAKPDYDVMGPMTGATVTLPGSLDQAWYSHVVVPASAKGDWKVDYDYLTPTGSKISVWAPNFYRKTGEAQKAGPAGFDAYKRIKSSFDSKLRYWQKAFQEAVQSEKLRLASEAAVRDAVDQAPPPKKGTSDVDTLKRSPHFMRWVKGTSPHERAQAVKALRSVAGGRDIDSADAMVVWYLLNVSTRNGVVTPYAKKHGLWPLYLKLKKPGIPSWEVDKLKRSPHFMNWVKGLSFSDKGEAIHALKSVAGGKDYSSTDAMVVWYLLNVSTRNGVVTPLAKKYGLWTLYEKLNKAGIPSYAVDDLKRTPHFMHWVKGTSIQERNNAIKALKSVAGGKDYSSTDAMVVWYLLNMSTRNGIVTPLAKKYGLWPLYEKLVEKRQGKSRRGLFVNSDTGELKAGKYFAASGGKRGFFVNIKTGALKSGNFKRV